MLVAALVDDRWRQWHWRRHWQWHQQNSGNGGLDNNQLRKQQSNNGRSIKGGRWLAKEH
jgi:hypothetical protein